MDVLEFFSHCVLSYFSRCVSCTGPIPKEVRELSEQGLLYLQDNELTGEKLS